MRQGNYDLFIADGRPEQHHFAHMAGLLIDQNKPNPPSVRHATGRCLYFFERCKPAWPPPMIIYVKSFIIPQLRYMLRTYNDVRLCFVTSETNE
jgi:hypothetical protein